MYMSGFVKRFRNSGWHRPTQAILLSLSCLFVLPGTSESQPADRLTDRIFVSFHPGVATPPPRAAAGAIDEFSFSLPDISALMHGLGIVKLERALPHFTAESVNTQTLEGKPVTLPNDLSHLYIATIEGASAASAIEALNKRAEAVRYAEPIYIRSIDFVPTDSLYWSQWWLENTGRWNGTPGEDIRANPAWNISTGASVAVGIMDTGIDLDHPDLVPVQAGDYLINPGTTREDLSGHGTAVAGIVGARGNNRIGVAGVNWDAYLVNFKVCTSETYCDNCCVDDAILSGIDLARVSQIPIMSASLSKTGFSNSIAYALQNYHAIGGLFVCSMGNDNANSKGYPAGYYETTEAVGAVFKDGQRWVNSSIPCGSSGGSNWGDWIDIVAPGGKMIATTSLGGGYYYVDSTSTNCNQGFSGTSASTPVVAGVASLIKSHRPELFGDDLAEVMHRTARRAGGTAWDQYIGWGVVNADSALRFAGGGKAVEHGEATGMTEVAVSSPYQMTFKDTQCPLVQPPVGPQSLWVRQRELRKWITFNSPFIEPPIVWARNGQSRGWSSASIRREIEKAVGWGGVVPGSVTAAGCSVFTYVYDILYDYPPSLNYYNCPVTPANAKVAFTAIGRVRQDPDITQSFYVPQTGSTSSPTEGTNAIKMFRACPNNDGGNSLPNNARIKIVIKDAQGNGIQGIPASDIAILFNGGTPDLEPVGQQFRGPGADSVIANSKYNPTRGCPDMRAMYADGPTDANGATYITFTGSSGTPGVGQRDPSRKWGHFDNELPVYVYWQKLQGRLTSGDVNGSYGLRIKSFDFTYNGLNATLDAGESVTLSEYNFVVAQMNGAPPNPLTYWADFDSSGAVNVTDWQMINNHINHNCNTPNDDQ